MSNRYAVLLRGVNVGGHGKLPMAELRRLLEAIGCSDVATYLQSGNAAVTVATSGAATLARDLRARLHSDRGLTVDVQVWSAEELAAVIAANPFRAAESQPTTLHVVFLPGAPDRDRLASLDPAAYAPDEFAVGERVIYLHCPNGLGRSKLAAALTSRAAQEGTARNWRTVTALAGMLA